jgi:phosphoglycerate dehydrogenase-like enzyme
MAHRILAIDYRYRQPARLALMQQYMPAGFELVFGDELEGEALMAEVREATAIVTQSRPLTAEMMQAAPKLKVVGSTRTGVDDIDIPAATALKLPVLHSPGWLRSGPVAEIGILLLLMHARKARGWGKTQVFDLATQLDRKTLGIVGLGNIGQKIARVAAALEMDVVAFTRTKGKFRPEGFAVTEMDSLDELLKAADFVMLCLPLTARTRGLIGARELGLMKDSAVLINIARGEHVVTDDLLAALRDGTIAGAAMDVTDPEPLPEDHPLWDMPNVLISPHVGSFTNELQDRSFELFCDNIRLAVEGKRPSALLNPEIYD